MKIRISAAALMRDDGAMLLVRKRGTSVFMQPGGKIDGDETPISALQRELSEELGIEIRPAEAKYLGRFLSPAANETGCVVIAELFHLITDADITAQSEIEEVRWFYPESQNEAELAPLTRDEVLPLVWSEKRPNS